MKMMKKYVFCLGALFFCMNFNVFPANGELVDRIVAVVNEDVISLYELNKVYLPYAEKITSAGYARDKEEKMVFKVREDILNKLIDQKLTDQEIRRLKIKVKDAEVDNAIERIKQASLYSDEELREALNREGMSLEDYRKRIREQILRTKLVNREVKAKIVITKEEVEEYYNSHSDEFAQDRKYHLRNILLKTPAYADDEEKRTVRKRLEEIKAEVLAGASFPDMARRHSETSLAEQGGDLGLYEFKDLSSQLKDELTGLKAGDMTSVMDTEQGFQLIYVEAIQEGKTKPLEEAASEIEERLFNRIVDEKFNAWVEDLRSRSHIKIIR